MSSETELAASIYSLEKDSYVEILKSTMENFGFVVRDAVRPLLEAANLVAPSSSGDISSATLSAIELPPLREKRITFQEQGENTDLIPLNPGYGIYDPEGPGIYEPEGSLDKIPRILSITPNADVYLTTPGAKAKGMKEYLVPCRYSMSGCPEMVDPGSISEKNHLKVCEFRPIECFVEGCGQEIPYHSFLIHMHQHFIYPTYESKLTTSIIIHSEDFESSGMWCPKWLSTENRHYFLMLVRSESGIWGSWVSMLGDASEAEEYVSRISFFKGNKCITGIYPVQSIRKTREEIMNSKKSCLLASDAMIKNVTYFEENVVTDLAMNVKIFLREELELAQEGQTETSAMEEPESDLPSEGSMIVASLNSAMIKLTSLANSISSQISLISESTVSTLFEFGDRS